MNVHEKQRVEELEKDVKKMQKELKETFAEFDEKKSPLQRLKEGIKKKGKKK